MKIMPVRKPSHFKAGLSNFVPTIDSTSTQRTETITERQKRKLKKDAVQAAAKKMKLNESVTAPTYFPHESQAPSSGTPLCQESQAPSCEVELQALLTPDVSAMNSMPIHNDAVTPETSLTTRRDPCSANCPHNCKLDSTKRVNRRLKKKVKELRQTIRILRENAQLREKSMSSDDQQANTSKYYTWTNSADLESEDDDVNVDQLESLAGEEFLNDEDWKPNHESSYNDESEEEFEEPHGSNVTVDPSIPEYNEPKFIVFDSMLLSLFSMFCFNCKEGKPQVDIKKNGTMVIVTQNCAHCMKAFVWYSQPLVLGKHPAGNIMLNFAVLMAGASISKLLLVFRHMGLAVHSARTFYRQQRKFLFPAVFHYWNAYRSSLLDKVKGIKEVVWSGDGRFDSMSHSAKYGVYTMFCTTLMKVIHFELVQANETGGSQQTELEGAKRAFKSLSDDGVAIQTFVSDRHLSLAKWIREKCKETTHYYDIWHVARSITKKLLKASKEKECSIIGDWMKGIRRHLYWCATSTKAGFSALIKAKWLSFLQHVANQHDGHPDSLFPSCNHGELEPRKWIRIGTPAYDKVKAILTKKPLLNAIEKLSPDVQTSCLEGFHSTLNHWHPKMIGFSWQGTFCRHVLASLQFNENLNRESKVSKEGVKYYRVTYPKFKLGEEVVREVTVPPTYGYVDCIKRILFTVERAELEKQYEKYCSKKPQPLNTQFPDRRAKETAVSSYKDRCKSKKTTAAFPSISAQSTMQNQHLQLARANASESASANRKERRCRTCKAPMRGHPRSRCPN